MADLSITLKDEKAGERTFKLQTGKMPDFLMTEFFAYAADADPEAAFDPALAIGLMEACIDDADLRRFKSWARKVTDFNSSDHFMDVLKARMDLVSGEHPTGEPSDSSDGQEDTSPKSENDSEDAQIYELADGRTDLYLGMKAMREAKRAKEAQAS